MLRACLLLLPLLCGCVRGRGDARVLRVVAAASLRDTFAALAAAFEREHPGVTVEPSFSSSGAAVQQLEQGAPFDLFYAADVKYAAEAERLGRVVAGTRRVYARGTLALWLPARLGLEPTSLDVLRDERVRRVAVANPELAPYGRAALQALERAGLREVVQPKLVFAQDASQAAQQALTAADAGLLPLSLARSPALVEAGRYVVVPGELHEPLDHLCVLVRDGADARAFYDYVLGEAGRRILAAHGFGLP
jgi:molybdate transport system substrate-binding protein